jgi:hypothetical protein
MNTYIVENDIANATSGLNLMEIQAPTDQSIVILEAELGIWETGPPADEMWRVRFGRYTTLGTAGDTITARPTNPSMEASGASFRSNHATEGTLDFPLMDFSFHIQNGMFYQPVPEARVYANGGDILGFLLENAPTATLDISFRVVYGEI